MNDLKTKYDLQEILSSEIRSDTEVPETETIITINSKIFAVKGDFSVIAGLPKTGKTAVCVYMIATALRKNFLGDSLGIQSKYCEGRPIIYFDTEQPRSKTKKVLKQVKMALGLNENEDLPSVVKFINLRRDSWQAKHDKIFSMFEHFPDAHLWIIDGYADLLPDTNDQEKSNTLAQRLMEITDKYNTTVIGHLHENPSGNKMRGHLGSELGRKCGGTITIKKKDSIHSIEATLLRYDEDFNPVFFKWSSIQRRLISCSDTEIQEFQAKSDTKGNEYLEAAVSVFENGKVELRHKDACNKIQTYTGMKEKTAKNWLNKMLEYNIVKKDLTGEYPIYVLLQKSDQLSISA
jgi:hypothetical protein